MPYEYSCDICQYLYSVLDKIEQEYSNDLVLVQLRTKDRGVMTNVAEILSAIGFIVIYNPIAEQLDVIIKT